MLLHLRYRYPLLNFVWSIKEGWDNYRNPLVSISLPCFFNIAAIATLMPYHTLLLKHSLIQKLIFRVGKKQEILISPMIKGNAGIYWKLLPFSSKYLRNKAQLRVSTVFRQYSLNTRFHELCCNIYQRVNKDMLINHKFTNPWNC